MGQGTQRGDDGGFLPTSRRGRGHEDAGELAPVASGLPLPAGGIPERLPLRREIAVASRDAQQEGVVAFKDFRGDEWDFGRLGGGVHQGEHFLRKVLFHSGGAERLAHFFRRVCSDPPLFACSGHGG